MPRLVKATAREIQRARRDWYAFHFEQHQQAMQLPAEHIRTYTTAISFIAPPTMTIFGGLPGDWPEPKAYTIAHIWHLNIHLMNRWYLTSSDWEAFQELWRELPEPIDIRAGSCVQVGELFTLAHMPAYANPPA